MSSTPNRTTLWLGAALVFVAMAALGWKLGTGSSANREPSITDAGPPASAADAALAEARAQSTRARQRVRGIRGGASAEQRLRATIELANTLSTEEFADWIDGGWFDYRSGFELTLFRRIVEERWRLEDPEGFVAWCLKDGQDSPGWSVSNPKGAALPLLTDWALHHPERLESFFAKHPDDALEAQLITNLAAEHPEQALARLKEMVGRGVNRNNYQLQTAIAQLAKSAPDDIEAILADLPASLRMQAENSLVGQRLATSFDEEIRALWERPDGWRLFSNNLHQLGALSEKLLAELPNLPESWKNGLTTHSLNNLLYNSDPEPWFNADLETAGFTAEQAQRIRGTALQALSLRNPERVLELLPDADLDENTRRSLVANTFQRLRNDPNKETGTFLALLTSDADRESAQAVIDSSGTAAASTQRQFQNPDEWIEGALSHNPQEHNPVFFGYALQQWNQEQIGELVERFRELPPEEKNRVATAVTGSRGANLDNYSPELAGEMIRHMLSSEPPATESGEPPGTVDPTRLASSTAAQWVVRDAPAASAWVDSLPEGEAKQWARNNLASSWANYDPPAMQSWLRSLPPDDRAEVQAFLENAENAE